MPEGVTLPHDEIVGLLRSILRLLQTMANPPMITTYPPPALQRELEKAGPGGIVYVDENMNPVSTPQKATSPERAWQIEQCKKHGYWKSLEYLLRHD